MPWILLASVHMAGIAPAHADTLLVLRGSVERWGDPAIGTVYRQGALMGGAGVVVDVFGPLSVDVDIAYRRVESDSGGQRFELLPISLLAEYRFPMPDDPIDPFVGFGFAIAHFAERAAPDDAGLAVVRGARPAIELRAGLRFDLGLIQPSMVDDPVVKGMDVEVYGARRIEVPGGQGFDLAAWRAGLGLALRL